ncbi:MAG: tetrahydromethanopterin S-methyltransferase subunit E [Methanimicrococcus sp.]|jgi:tetrahydromethanopterin S-methyltransferase subunit E|nr:tetrahydromethanopterin S-methyltransferase subunit E [Methanimicrococcus sp.]
MDPLFGMGVLALVSVFAAIAGYTEDLESVVGSQSNPNSQVQLAPQMKYPHRLFNKAISGEPLSNAIIATIGSVVAFPLLLLDISPLAAIVGGAFVATLVHIVFATTSFLGRITSQSRFKQPIYMDVYKTHIPVIAAYAFLTVACVLIICFLMTKYLEIPIPAPILAFVFGIMIGSIGSAVGDTQYGAERLYQNLEFGSGVNAAYSGNIARKAESGTRSGIDNSWFSSKFGGPATGITCAAVVVMTSGLTLLFNPEWGETVGWVGVAAAVLFIIITVLINRYIEKTARKRFGPYRENEKTEAIK